MDALIFYAFLLVLVIAFLIEGQRATSKVQPAQAQKVERPLWARAMMVAAFVIAALASKLIIEPLIEEYVPGANTAWVLSFIALSVLLGGTIIAIERLGARSPETGERN